MTEGGAEKGGKAEKEHCRDKSRRVGTAKALLCVGPLPAPGRGRCSSLLPAHPPPPHPIAHSALRAPIKYSFSKTGTYVTSATSVSPCWPDVYRTMCYCGRGANNQPAQRAKGVGGARPTQNKWYSRPAPSRKCTNWWIKHFKGSVGGAVRGVGKCAKTATLLFALIMRANKIKGRRVRELFSSLRCGGCGLSCKGGSQNSLCVSLRSNKTGRKKDSAQLVSNFHRRRRNLRSSSSY